MNQFHWPNRNPRYVNLIYLADLKSLAVRGQNLHFFWCTERKKERKKERKNSLLNKLQQNLKPRAKLCLNLELFQQPTWPNWQLLCSWSTHYTHIPPNDNLCNPFLIAQSPVANLPILLPVKKVWQEIYHWQNYLASCNSLLTTISLLDCCACIMPHGISTYMYMYFKIVSSNNLRLYKMMIIYTPAFHKMCHFHFWCNGQVWQKWNQTVESRYRYCRLPARRGLQRTARAATRHGARDPLVRPQVDQKRTNCTFDLPFLTKTGWAWHVTIYLKLYHIFMMPQWGPFR